MAEESSCSDSHSAEVLSRVSNLLGSSTGSQREGAGARPRQALQGRGSRQQPLCRVGGCDQSGAREGLRTDIDGGNGAVRKESRVQAPVSHHP